MVIHVSYGRFVNYVNQAHCVEADYTYYIGT